MDSFAEKVIEFYQNIRVERNLPEGIEAMHPHLRPDIGNVSREFYRKFYSDNQPRTFIIGINPGRFGGGATGIPFTDPAKLEICGIKHELQGRSELSADFIYRVIVQYGGPDKFYRKFYFTSLSPLGFKKAGLNLNYYDDKELVRGLLPLMASWMDEQASFGTNDSCICLGSGKNLACLYKLNSENQWFKRIDVLEHPRYIMQYKRKKLQEYLSRYLAILNQDSL